MSDLKRVLPTFPKSIEEHDREVNETWQLENGLDNPFKNVYEGMIEEQLGEKDLLKYVIYKQHIEDPLFGPQLLYFLKISDDLKIKMVIKNLKTEVITYWPAPEANLCEEDGLVCECFEDVETKNLHIFSTFNEARDFVVETIKNNTKKASDYKCEYCCDGDKHECGKSLLKDSIGIFDTPIVDIDIFIDGVEGLKMLVTNASDATIIRKVMKIKYCPMCGRLLDNKHEQDNLKQLMKETMLNGLPEDLADAILNGDDRAVAEKVDRYKGGE